MDGGEKRKISVESHPKPTGSSMRTTTGSRCLVRLYGAGERGEGVPCVGAE